jgi:AraC-like DNA-binding protein
MRNHEALNLKAPALEILICRRDTLDKWRISSTVKQAPYWRLYIPYNNKGLITWRGRDIRMSQGTFWLIAPKTVFDARLHEGFLDKFYAHFIVGGEHSRYSDEIWCFPAKDWISVLADRISGCLWREERGPRFLADVSALCFLALSMIPEPPPEHPASTGSGLLRIIRGMKNNPGEKLSNEAFARQARMSENSFITKFKRSFGATPRKMLNSLRAEKAASLLRETSLSLDEIAALTGFCDRFHLSKIFRQYKKTSPALFRKTREP